MTMIMIEKETVELALNALEQYASNRMKSDFGNKAIKAIKKFFEDYEGYIDISNANIHIHYPQQHATMTVRVVSFPQSNGKINWTAMFVRTQPWDGLIGNAGGITIDRGECWNRVAYKAECARFLLGERTTEPSIIEYAKDIRTPEQWDGKDIEAAHCIKE